MLMLWVCLVFVTLISTPACRAQSGEECGRNCFMNKDTFICTDVPSCIPEGITRIEVNNTSPSEHSVLITVSNFTGKNWDIVTYLRLEDSTVTGFKKWTLSEASFVTLESLRELHINIRQLGEVIDPNVLVGLSKVEVIDFTGCYSLNIEQLLMILNGTNKLAGLKKIVLSDWNRWSDASYNFDRKLVDVLLPRNITDIDLSNSHINILDVTTLLKQMVHLQSLNVTNGVITDIYAHQLGPSSEHLKVFDISGLTLPNALGVPQIRYVLNNYVYHFTDAWEYWSFFFSIHTIKATGLFKEPLSVWSKDCQVIVTKKHHFHIKELEGKENNLNRLDFKVQDGDLTFDLEYLGLSNNGLEFLHSSLLSCSPNLTKLDLSRNRLYIMLQEDEQHFSQLLSGLPVLTDIDLSHNNLTHIPRDFIKGCRELSTINLSYNRLTQFTMNVSDHTRLISINLRNNNIKILDATSLHNLNSIPRTSKVVITSNPISCSVCAAKPFLQWLLSTPHVNILSQGLNCTDEKDNKIAIDGSVISTVHQICIRKTIIISVTVSTAVALLSVIAVITWLYKRRKRANILAHRRAVIDKIRNADGPYEFPVFFSYSSKDDDFAQDNVLPHLNDTLKQITTIYHDRNLVCIGDANLRPGFYVHDEIDFCLDRSSVVIVLVTEDYCASDYCGSELEKSYMKKKPVILMFKEHVDEDLMSRTMRELYKRNVRILWAEQNGEYILQTTWENVCTSILDLVE